MKRDSAVEGSDLVCDEAHARSLPLRPVPRLEPPANDPNPEVVPVVRPTLPPLGEVCSLLEGVWERRMLSNRGPLSERFERALSERLDLPHLSLVANATLGLEIALRSIASAGEVITTPFSFVATSHSILNAGLTPVFADIDPTTYNLDPAKVEAAITPNTVAILPVHCYGRPCDPVGFEALGRRHGIPVIFDAAHAFAVTLGGKSLLGFGDISVVSFHATKVFHSAEGGAIVCADRQTKLRIDRMGAFGIDGDDVTELGTNAKLSELHCALGLALLPHFEASQEGRARVISRYRAGLEGIEGLRFPAPAVGYRENHAYFPVEVSPEREDRDALLQRLKRRGFLARKYFSPILTELEVMKRLAPKDGWPSCPAAKAVSARILCLPLFSDLSNEQVDEICAVVRDEG